MDYMETFFTPLSTTFFVVVTSVILLYWYSVRNHNYWKKRGVPSARTVPFFGSFIDFFSKGIQDVEMERYLKHGRLYGQYEGNTPVLSVAEPALMREILVKDFQFFPDRRHVDTGDEMFNSMVSLKTGDDWKRIRTILTPTFTTGKIKRMLGIFKDCAKTLIQNMKNATEAGKPVDAKRMYGAFVMDNIASSAFSTKIDSHNDPENEFVKSAKGIFTQTMNWRVLFFVIAPRLMFLLGIAPFKRQPLDFFKNVTLQIIEERKRTGQVRNDFLQLLLDTAKEVSEEQKMNVPEKESGDIASNYICEGEQIFKNVSNKYLSRVELVAQCVIFFLAGYDTITSTLSFATYLLAVNPEIQDKLRTEVDEALMETGGELTYESIQNMKYLDNVISETLRLYPIAVRMERQALSDYKLGDTGITIPKGMGVTMPIYAMQRDPEYFPEPEKFDPDRFSGEERAKREQYAYMPFGAGPRNCLGMRFALMEMKVCLSTVIATFNVKKSPQTQVPLQLTKSLGLLDPKEILVEMEVRTDSPLKI